MSQGLLLRILLSFAIAGTWISLATVASERLGTRIGGLVGNLPSNLLVSLLFIALTRGPEYAAAAAGSVPVGMAVDTLFLLAFIAGLRAGLAAATGLSLLVWLAAAGAAAAIPPFGRWGAVLLYALVCVLVFAIVEWGLRIKAVPKKPSRFSWKVVLVRAIFAGGIVSGAVLAAQYAPPYLTGIVSTFPAVLLSTMVILTRSQGPDFARATGKVLVLSSSNIIVYSLAASFLFVRIGPWLGTLCAFAAAAAYVALFLPIARRLA